jgi:hypothetical protein
MRSASVLLLSIVCMAISSCASRPSATPGPFVSTYNSYDYAARIPQQINATGEKVVVVYPTVYTWGAYNEEGDLIRAGIATSGGKWCEDLGRPCQTSVGTFRIRSLGDGSCISTRYPLPNGGGLMPYCMYFSGNMALHGSPDGAVVEDNISHGCVRMLIPDAEWLRYNFASRGTKVIVQPY